MTQEERGGFDNIYFQIYWADDDDKTDDWSILTVKNAKNASDYQIMTATYSHI